MKKLCVGQKYPSEFLAFDGARAQFLQEKNTLIVMLPNISRREIKAFLSGKLYCGLLYSEGAMLLLWQFNDKKDQPVLFLETPFDSRLISDIRKFELQEGHDRLLIDIHVVESTTSRLKCTKQISMSPELSQLFMKYVIEQRECAKQHHLQHKLWQQREPSELIQYTKKFPLGVG